MAKNFDSFGVVDVIIEKPKMTIQGYIVNNVETDASNREEFVFFFGIPYAKPPTEKCKRYAAPEPFVYNRKEHGDPFKASKGFKMCPQVDETGNPVITKIDEKDDPLDCLHLNIYIPKRPNKIKDHLAVMVYFHGGGFFQGSGNYAERTPESMMQHDVILVTVNYRLGPFGFLNLHADTCVGNAGLKDQVKALEWVRDNISCFKGDPDNVTIWGESAGGSCVNFHLISPLSKGLFKKAIIQSGGIYCPWGYTGDQRKLKAMYEKYAHLLEEKKHAMIVDKLAEADYADILTFNEKMERKINEPGSVDIHVGPSIETILKKDTFLPCGPKALIENANPVPILAGITSHEGYMTYEFAGPIYQHPYDWILDKVRFCKFLKAHLHWEEQTIEEHFCNIRMKYFNVADIEFVVKNRASRSDECLFQETEAAKLRIKDCLAVMCTDLWFYRFYDNIKLGAGSKTPDLTYIYEFDFVSRLNPSNSLGVQLSGASHGDDIGHLLPTSFNRSETMPFREDEERKIRTMCSLWASFAKTSIPETTYHNIEPRWLPHLEEKPCYLKIGEELVMKEGRMNDENWQYLNDINRYDEDLKALKSNPYERNTISAIPITIEFLNEAVRKAKSELAAKSTLPLPETANKSESSTSLPETASKKESSNLRASCPGGLDVLEHSSDGEGPSSLT